MPFLAAARASSSIHRIRPQRWSPSRRRFASSALRVNARFRQPSSSACHASTPKPENVLGKDEILASISLPPPKPNSRSTYHKILDREAWTHAVASAAIVLEMDGETSKSARIVLGGVAPIPWRLQKVEAMLAGQRITPELAARAGEAAVEGANPLAKNAYKVPLTKALVRRTLVSLAQRA